jgi:methylmalonyl-CoA/ethylmalonyl-CoA epimerase
MVLSACPSVYANIPIMLLRIDHVGIACRSLDAAVERYVSVFGLDVVSREVNEEQGVKEAMLATTGLATTGLATTGLATTGLATTGLATTGLATTGGTSYVQLLEPLGPDTPVGRFLERRGEGLHHVGYAVADVTAALAEIGGRGVRLIDSRPRHGSMGASIAFLHPGDLGGVLTELVQPRSDS